MCAMPVGPGELLLILIVILVIVVVVRGPKVLPQFGEAIGKTIKGIRQNVDDGDDKADAGTGTSTSEATAADTAAKPDDADKPGS